MFNVSVKDIYCSAMHLNNLNLLPCKATLLIHSPNYFSNIKDGQGFAIRDCTSDNWYGVMADHGSVLHGMHRRGGGA